MCFFDLKARTHTRKQNTVESQTDYYETIHSLLTKLLVAIYSVLVKQYSYPCGFPMYFSVILINLLQKPIKQYFSMWKYNRVQEEVQPVGFRMATSKAS